MAAFDNATVTIDTDEMVYTDRQHIQHTVTNAETFVFTLTSRGTQTVYRLLAGSTLALESGETLTLVSAQALSEFTVDTDATAKLNAGSLTFRENWLSEDRAIWDIRTVTIDNIDEPTDLSITLERRDDPIYSMTLTNVTVAQ